MRSGLSTRKSVLLWRQHKPLIKRGCLAGFFCSFRSCVKCHLPREYSLTTTLTSVYSSHSEHPVFPTALITVDRWFCSVLVSYSMGIRMIFSLPYHQCLEKHLALSRCTVNGHFIPTLSHSPLLKRNKREGFPGGAVVENLPANAGDTGSSPGLGRSHMPRSS